MYRTAEKCLSVVEPNLSSNSPCCSSPSLTHGRGISPAISKNSVSQFKYNVYYFCLFQSSEIGFSKHDSSMAINSPHHFKQSDADSGLDLGRGSNNSSNGVPNNLPPLDEMPANDPINEVPFGMVLTHAPAKISDALTADDYAIPPDATNNLPQMPFLNSKPSSMTLPRNSEISRDTLMLSNNSSPMHLPSSSAMRASLIPSHESVSFLKNIN